MATEFSLVIGSLMSGFAGYLVTVFAPIPALCVAFEVVMLGQTRMRAVLLPASMVRSTARLCHWVVGVAMSYASAEFREI